jgi:hypothetical protein
MSLAELGRAVVAMSDRQLVAYMAGMDPDELEVLEQAVAEAEDEAGVAGAAAARAREHESTAGRYARWWSDPAAFAAEAFTWEPGKGLHTYQSGALTTLATDHRLALQKPRGVGGTAIAGVAVLWFAATRDYYGVDWKVITTASVGRQLEDYLWPEVHKWARRLRWEQLGRAPWLEGKELLHEGVKLAHGLAFTASPGPGAPASIEGAHATQVLVVFEEPKLVRTAVFDAVEGGSTRYGPETGATLFALAAGTPGEPTGRFYDLCRGEAGAGVWSRQQITLAEGIAAGQVSPSSAEELRSLWGEDSALYANHVLGEFRADAANTVIPLSWIQAANERWGLLGPGARAVAALYAGVDVAREGKDRSVLYAIAGDVCGRGVELPRGDGVVVARGCLSHVGVGVAGPHVLVDSEGVGASVYDHLRRMGRDLMPRVHAFRAGTGTDWRDVSGKLWFANLRSAAWWHLRELLDPALDARLALPPGDVLTGDLTTPKWRDTTRGIVIESKDEIRKRLGRSTDDGDALVMAAWGPVMVARGTLRPATGSAAAGEGSLMGDIYNEGL